MIGTGNNAQSGKMDLALKIQHHSHSLLLPLIVLELESLTAPLWILISLTLT